MTTRSGEGAILAYERAVKETVKRPVGSWLQTTEISHQYREPRKQTCPMRKHIQRHILERMQP